MPLKKAGSSRGYSSPGKYIQGPGELGNLFEYAGIFGTRALIIIDPFFHKQFAERLTRNDGEFTSLCVEFGGECCAAEIDRIAALAEKLAPKICVGIGGGKTVDTAKAVATRFGAATMLYPTAASTDAPTSNVSVLYNPDHTLSPLFHKTNPELVVVDTDIIVKAPLRMLVAGIGDALATYFEARASKEANNVNNVLKGYRQTIAGSVLAKACFDVLMERGVDAVRAAAKGLRTEAFEDVVEANTLLSGLGVDNAGCSLAHGLQASFGVLPDTHKYLHGEIVAFGTLCELVAENRPSAEIARVVEFCAAVGLPVTLAQIGVAEDVAAKLDSMLDYAMANKPILHVEPFTVTKSLLLNAILYVDTLGAQALSAE